MKKLVASIAAGLLALLFISTVNGQNPPPPPPPPPGGVGLTPPPAPGSTAVPTATEIPLTVSLTLGHGSLSPGKKQSVAVTTLPAASVRIVVHFPNGDSKTATGTADSSGHVPVWTFTQAISEITRQHKTAKVTAIATSGSRVASAAASYAIGFAAIDVSVQPRTQSRGSGVSVWAHSAPKTHLVVSVHWPVKSGRTFHVVTGPKGWKRIAVSVPSSAHTGTGKVSAKGKVRGRAVQAGTTFKIR